MDVDGMDAFNRLLERVEELSADNTRLDSALSSFRDEAQRLRSEKARFSGINEELARLQGFVESTPERLLDWRTFITVSPKNDDDTPF